jgi:hypothetical protein
MTLHITESEVRKAVVQWLKNKYNISVKEEELIPTYDTQGDYDQSTTNQTGYEIKDFLC